MRGDQERKKDIRRSGRSGCRRTESKRAQQERRRNGERKQIGRRRLLEVEDEHGRSAETGDKEVDN